MPAVPKPTRTKSVGKSRRSPSAQAWLDRVSQAGCVMCREIYGQHRRAAIHHPREGQGGGQRAPDFLAIGLCRDHHQGAAGFHGLGKLAFYARYRLDEMDLLAMTIEGVLSEERGTSHGDR